jgi:hypothetical protein
METYPLNLNGPSGGFAPRHLAVNIDIDFSFEIESITKVSGSLE